MSAPIYLVCDGCGFFYGDIRLYEAPTVDCPECGTTVALAFGEIAHALDASRTRNPKAVEAPVTSEAFPKGPTDSLTAAIACVRDSLGARGTPHHEMPAYMLRDQLRSNAAHAALDELAEWVGSIVADATRDPDEPRYWGPL